MSSSHSSPLSKPRTTIIEYDPQALEDHFQKSLSLINQNNNSSTWKSKNLPDSFFNHKRNKNENSTDKIKILNSFKVELSAAEINRQTRVRKRSSNQKKHNHTRNVSEPVPMGHFDPFPEMPNSVGKTSWYGREESCSGPVRSEPKHVRASSLTVNNPIARRNFRQNIHAMSGSNSEKSTISPNSSFDNLSKFGHLDQSSGFHHHHNNKHALGFKNKANFVTTIKKSFFLIFLIKRRIRLLRTLSSPFTPTISMNTSSSF